MATATFVAPNLVPGWLVGFSLMAAGMLTVAWALWRIPEDVWHPRAVLIQLAFQTSELPFPTARRRILKEPGGGAAQAVCAR